jgi:hypothetical protein
LAVKAGDFVELLIPAFNAFEVSFDCVDFVLNYHLVLLSPSPGAKVGCQRLSKASNGIMGPKTRINSYLTEPS